MLEAITILFKPRPPEYESELYEIEQQYVNFKIPSKARANVSVAPLFVQEVNLMNYLLEDLNEVACEGECVICIEPGIFLLQGEFSVYYPFANNDLYNTFNLLIKLRETIIRLASLPVEFEEINIKFNQKFVFNEED